MGKDTIRLICVAGLCLTFGFVVGRNEVSRKPALLPLFADTSDQRLKDARGHLTDALRQLIEVPDVDLDSNAGSRKLSDIVGELLRAKRDLDPGSSYQAIRLAKK